VLRQH